MSWGIGVGVSGSEQGRYHSWLTSAVTVTIGTAMRQARTRNVADSLPSQESGGGTTSASTTDAAMALCLVPRDCPGSRAGPDSRLPTPTGPGPGAHHPTPF